MRKLDQVEQNALDFLAQVGEFTLPDLPTSNVKAAAIARVMDSLVRKKCAIILHVEDGLPRYAITLQGRDRASLVH